MFWQTGQWAGVQGIFGFGLIAALLITRPAVRADPRARIAAGLASIYAAALMWDPGWLAFTLFWTALGMVTLLPGTARFDDGWRWFQRLLIHCCKSLIRPLIDLTIISWVRRKRPPRPIGLRRSLPVLVLPLLGSAVFVWLFAQANPVIEHVLNALQWPAADWPAVPRVVLWGVCAMLAWGVLRARLPRRLIAPFDGTGDAVLPGVSLASVTLSLIAFNGVFVMQNGLDAAYLSGLAALPPGITLAGYAHRGAYPLIATALLAALFVLVTLRPGSSTAASPLVRRLVTLWIAQNLLLVASAALRTWDYVEAYSLTVLRLSALLWMALVAVGLVLVLWRMLRGKSAAWLINANLLSAGLLLTAVCFIDLGAVAAQWNVRHARETGGTGASLDLCYLNELGHSSLLPLIELEQHRLSAPLAISVPQIRWQVQQQRRGGWTLLRDWRLAQARQRLGPAFNTAQLGQGPCYARYDN